MCVCLCVLLSLVTTIISDMFISDFCTLYLQSSFNAPVGNEPIALDMNTMGKGQVWVNGRNIGRHWPAYTAHGNCGRCNYAGIYSEKKCLSNCGQSSQRW